MSMTRHLIRDKAGTTVKTYCGYLAVKFGSDPLAYSFAATGTRLEAVETTNAHFASNCRACNQAANSMKKRVSKLTR